MLSPLDADAQRALEARLAQALSDAAQTTVTVRSLAPLSGGACQDNYRVDLRFDDGPLAGERRYALRSDARQSLPGSLRRREEYDVVRAAVAAGVRTPEASFFAPGLVREGADAYLLAWREGEALGRRVVRNPELAAAREGLPDALAASLAAVHSITPSTHPQLALTQFGDGRARGAVEGSLGFLRAMLDTLREPHPALELVTRWLDAHRPAGADELTLVHGDFRTGNFLVSPQGLEAVLDWEFAHWGTPMEDLGWLCVRDWRFGRLELAAGGFARRERMYEAYERASGRRVDPAAVRWWEVMGNARWAAGSLFQGERYLSGEERDLELIAIARRACEMEYEALRLLSASP